MTFPSPASNLLVSVVIPTRGRPQLLLERAVRSALAQTYPHLEVIVVVDGPDPETEGALSGVADARLRVLALPENVGGGEARNAGVRAARGSWIALLDDDDEWLPHKLEGQLRVAEESRFALPIVACRWIARVEGRDYPQPVRLPDPGERLCDYLLAPKSYFVRDCSFMSTLILTPRELLLRVPFTPGLPKHQDTDWLLRAGAQPGVGVEFLDEIAAVWYFEEGRAQMSRTRNWRGSLRWAKTLWRGGLMTNQAYVGFLVAHLATYTQRRGEWRAMWPLLREILLARPRAFELLHFAVIWAFPVSARTRARALIARLRGRRASPESANAST